MTYLLWALMVGATAAGLTVALRALPLIARQVEALRKPWVCDICMSFWTTALIVVGLALWQHNVELVVVAGPAYPWAMWVLRVLTGPREGGPPLPPLEDSDA